MALNQILRNYKIPEPIDAQWRFTHKRNLPQQQQRPKPKNQFGGNAPIGYDCHNCGKHFHTFDELDRHKPKCKHSEIVNIEDEFGSINGE